MLAGGAAGFGLLAAVVASPLSFPFAIVAIVAGCLAWQSYRDDRRRMVEARQCERERQCFEKEESAYSQLRRLRKQQVSRAYASVRARSAAGAGRRDRRHGVVVEDELSQTDLQQFFMSINRAAHDPDGRAAYIPPAPLRAGVRDGQLAEGDIAKLFGVDGNQLFVSEESPAD
ncbi:hypothetical protein BI344_08920 [Chromobacterium sphagni]|uniref:Uncharacterized protein n=1 Tax=Chromobacterium sphagni TaxID=1903179 RepID=A0ABX3CCI6_9NEIS|nr:hypothetical protein BI344_08920 [Chromobacterium sphagni]